MADRQNDPSRLRGEALQRWYTRSPDELELQRQTLELDRHADFFSDDRAEGEMILVGNPYNRGLRRQWEQREGRPWPRDPKTNRNYDVGHIRAIGDGGTNTLDNIAPVHPDEHVAQHRANGDYARWARRQHIARAFGGTVARGIAAFSALSPLLGILNGRVRLDNFDNAFSDMAGVPSAEDQILEQERIQRLHNPKWKRGDPLVL